ncbi:neuroligin-1 isoform X1 [Oncorhynchus nerka]|uniref:neuroligin-1 isoform X1 n=1 Tax=Oncorhynchus nerka TaxID=8023 RepID=UPI0031B88DAF
MKEPSGLLRLSLSIGLLFLYTLVESNAPVVQTKLGGLRGQYVSVKGKETVVQAYLGVPFAKPPVGPLRLAPPQPVEGWEGVRDAIQQPLMCFQDRQITKDLYSNVSMTVEIPEVSEDCLYLNIYTPVKPAEKTRLHVMVWIHGGGFAIGSASAYDGSALAAYQDVVVVLIQYRLGWLGFFSTGDKYAPGNMGLLDQVEALRWVQEHIHNFGGDSKSVTIFGESAGGASVSLLLLSPLSIGLFHGAIAESGTATMKMLFTPNPLLVAQTVANLIGCESTNTVKIADCVKKLTADHIMNIQKQNQMLFFGVTADGQFLSKSAMEISQNHEMHKVPFMTGVNDNEGGWLLAKFFAPPGWEDGVDRVKVIPMMAMFYPDPKDQWITELIADEYLGTSGNRVKNRDGFTELLGDIMFTIPALQTANFHRDAGVPVYLYEFQQTPSMLKKMRPSFVGSDHGDELMFVFGICFTSHFIMDGCAEKDEQLSRIMMSYWGNFARTGSPNGAGLVQWPQYGLEGHYLGIGLEQVPGQHLKRDRFTFLTQTVPEKLRLGREKMEQSDLPKTGPVVQTKLGGLRGQYVSVKGKETVVQAYLGVPFAKPPVGPLRLTPPQPVEGWERVRDATQQPLMCLQDRQRTVDFESNWSIKVEIPAVSEDCLYLNIYTPAKPAENTKLPVMVWIHGGGFTMGSASTYDGSALAAYQDVVVVVIQYRLGLLGFFSTGDKYAPGNMGLLDQVEALRWVQEHIHNFGGDSKSVTIFGESAGGVSVSLLLHSPLSAGLFHRAIAESGTAAMDAIIHSDPLSVAQMVATILGCNSSNTEQIADCVEKLTADDIVNVHKQNQMLRIGVTVGGHFLPKLLTETFHNHEMHKVPFLTGTNTDEGWLLANMMAPPGWVDGIDREQVMPLLALCYPDPKDQWITELIADEYLGTSGDRIKNRDGFIELVGDALFTIPALKTAGFHRDAGVPMYLYEFQQTPSMLKKMRPSFVGSDHGDELMFVFGYCFTTSHVTVDASCTEEDEQLSGIMMSYWGNFARTGSPNGVGLVQWPQYGPEGDYLGIGLEQVPGQHLKRDRFTFMTKILPEKVHLVQEKIKHSEL